MSTHYSQVFIAILAMLLLLMFPWVYAKKSFTQGIFLKVLALGTILITALAWLSQFLMN